MKTFGKVIICIIVVLLAIGIASLIFNKGEKNTTNTGTNVSNTNNANTQNQLDKENKDYIGLEEKQEEPEENKEDEDEKNTVVDQIQNEEQNTEKSDQQEEPQLTGEDKAIDVVTKQYAAEGQTVSVHHMEGENYVVKLKDRTGAVTWYLVNGATWEVEEY